MNSVKQKLSKLRNKEKATLLSRFFKTGKGEYGEGDIFWGVNVPEQRKIAKESLNLSFKELQELLENPVHEFRLTSLLILTYKYKSKIKNQKSKFKVESQNSNLIERENKQIFNFYIKNIKYINNWDLVDVSCHKIVGAYLFDKDRKQLYKLAHSKKLWEKRIAIISTFYFIARNDFSDSIKIAEILLSDKHDLIHKAVGWMLREVGKRDENLLHNFLKKNIKKMPRTSLRYAIERLPNEFRQYYLSL